MGDIKPETDDVRIIPPDPTAESYLRGPKTRNPDQIIRLDGEKDTLYQDGLDLEDDSRPLTGVDGRDDSNPGR
jgi:hypothetical protein